MTQTVQPPIQVKDGRITQTVFTLRLYHWQNLICITGIKQTQWAIKWNKLMRIHFLTFICRELGSCIKLVSVLLRPEISILPSKQNNNTDTSKFHCSWKWLCLLKTILFWHCIWNKKALLSQRRPRDAPNIWVPWKVLKVLANAPGYFSRNL